jgi:hypothetical protein
MPNNSTEICILSFCCIPERNGRLSPGLSLHFRNITNQTSNSLLIEVATGSSGKLRFIVAYLSTSKRLKASGIERHGLIFSPWHIHEHTHHWWLWVPHVQLIDGKTTSVRVETNSPKACYVTKQRWCQLHTQMKTNMTRTSAIITFWVYQTITFTRITMTGCRTSAEGHTWLTPIVDLKIFYHC